MVPNIQDYLYKKVTIGSEIVTYRVLSREFSIHVNEAKRELERFHSFSLKGPTPVHATYLLAGVPEATFQDTSIPTTEDTHEKALFTRSLSHSSIMLVRGENLEKIKSQFTRISSIHIYGISPSTLTDPVLLTTTAPGVRSKDDASRNPEYAKLIGTTLNPHWNETIKGKMMAEPIKPASKAVPKPSGFAPTPPAGPKVTEGASTKLPKAEEKKRTGTLDWGKTKTKAIEENKDGEGATSARSVLAERSPSSSKTFGADGPSPMLIEPSSGDPTPPTRTASGRRLRKRILLSDEEVDEDPKTTAKVSPPKKRKSVAPEASDDDSMAGVSKKLKGSRLMVTSDEEHYAPGSAQERKVSHGDESESSGPEHTPLSASELRRKMQDPRFKAERIKEKQKNKSFGIDVSAAKGKQEAARAARKKAPKGKRKVQKTRTYKDAKGRTVTEDYSSFESDEEPKTSEATSGPNSTGTGTKVAHGQATGNTSIDPKPATRTKASTNDEKKLPIQKKTPVDPSTKSNVKPRNSGQQTLAGFFKK
ncbi:DNA polymerase subunit Cdc27 [Cantharellus anzutake]|uniref:DNA polymerase subunit Cdc27 n=1 Tax=Cantharellus anzutake TaxID=1750568 RepID=UPI001903A327|nr:DNA polymerase subunit Cdc27 [Cantharellus anzutake]KAF8323476.1 DNA polymerase subunit Cdc27 [Cantharellus anzutake]